MLHNPWLSHCTEHIANMLMYNHMQQQRQRRRPCVHACVSIMTESENGSRLRSDTTVPIDDLFSSVRAKIVSCVAIVPRVILGSKFIFGLYPQPFLFQAMCVFRLSRYRMC